MPSIFWIFVGLICVDLTSAQKTKADILVLNDHEGSERTKSMREAMADDLVTMATASASVLRLEKVSSYSTLATVGLNYIRTLAGTGSAGFNGDEIDATIATLDTPLDLAVDQAGDIYIADAYNHRIRKITVSTGKISTIAGTSITGYNGDKIDATKANLYLPQGVGVDGVGNVYIADSYNHRLRKVTVSTGIITTIAGTGIRGSSLDGVDATSAHLNQPASVCVDLVGNIYIADSSNHCIKKVSASTLKITTVAGTGYPGFSGDGMVATSAQLYNPLAVAVDRVGNLYIADSYNHRLRKVTASTGNIDTVAGASVSGFSSDGIDAIGSALYYPKGVAVDPIGDIFIADSSNYRIRKVIVSTGKMITIAGTGIQGTSGDGVDATSANLNFVTGIAVDLFGNFYIADTRNHRIRSMTGARRTAPPSVSPSMTPTTPPSVSPSMTPTTPPPAESSMAPTTPPSVSPSMTPTTPPADSNVSKKPTACPSMRRKTYRPTCKKPSTIRISAPPTQNIKTSAPSRKCKCRKRSKTPSASPSKDRD